MLRRTISSFLLILLGFGIGYGYLHSKISLNEGVKVNPVSKTEFVEYPKCVLGRCPEFKPLYVMGENEFTSAVIVPRGMSQGAGEVWIIREGTDEKPDEVVFKSDNLMRIGVFQTKEQQGSSNGFTLVYGTEVNNNKKGKRVEYSYKNGAFVLTNEEEF